MSAAVVIPVYRAALSDTEKISLVQCCRVLSRHSVVIVAPDGLDLAAAQEVCVLHGVSPRVERFPAGCFRTRNTYNALVMSRDFYERFTPWEYILIYQLDAFVFSDRLLEFCKYGYDYIGAPWDHGAEPRRRVGNGGFSLRKVSTALRVLSGSWSRFPLGLDVAWRRVRPLRLIRRHVWRSRFGDRLMQSRVYIPRIVFDALCVDEDSYWGPNCEKLAFYRTAPYAVALSFAFELDPATAFQRNGSNLPFGCHGWQRWHTAFWEPHINRLGYAWEASAARAG